MSAPQAAIDPTSRPLRLWTQNLADQFSPPV